MVVIDIGAPPPKEEAGAAKARSGPSMAPCASRPRGDLVTLGRVPWSRSQ